MSTSEEKAKIFCPTLSFLGEKTDLGREEADKGKLSSRLILSETCVHRTHSELLSPALVVHTKKPGLVRALASPRSYTEGGTSPGPLSLPATHDPCTATSVMCVADTHLSPGIWTPGWAL